MTLLPVLTDYEKSHLSERQPLPERYVGLTDEEMDRRIAAAKAKLEALAQQARVLSVSR